ncbi:hypothetical protein VTL71DRAFT_14782 [Oculimacula yallundae]|uniref:Uncharacterized protein n=1 Tax=Oculimacula yallundae TaxID=86028 RepID=A0ABR4CJF7_9HELO
MDTEPSNTYSSLQRQPKLELKHEEYQHHSSFLPQASKLHLHSYTYLPQSHGRRIIYHTLFLIFFAGIYVKV